MAVRNEHSGPRLDAFRLAREHGVVEGSVDAHQLPRVDDLLAEGPATVAWRIEGTADASGRPALSIDARWFSAASRASAASTISSGRSTSERNCCLRATSASSRCSTPTARSEVVLAGTPVEPLTLVEDELVLALPFAPRHPEGACST